MEKNSETNEEKKAERYQNLLKACGLQTLVAIS